MLRRIDLSTADAELQSPRRLRAVLPRAAVDVDTAGAVVGPLIEEIRDHGYSAVRAATLRFDGVDVADPSVSRTALTNALASLDPAVRAALEESIRRARIVHSAQRRASVDVQVVPGGTVTEKWIPVDRVGLYVPGGLAVYPSSVVMNVVPAQEAGVTSMVVCSPPQREFGGLPHPTILAACELLGVTEVYAVGGAQAIALLAYGCDAQDPVGQDSDAQDPNGQASDDHDSDAHDPYDQDPDGQDRAAPNEAAPAGLTIEPVDIVTGPGNVYVAAAKRLLRGVVGIDAEAGPTEIAILADAGADPAHVAADLISQAEHDPSAASVLVTDSAALADAVEAALRTQVAETKHIERVSTALTGPQSAIVLVRDLEQGLSVVDAYAAEHLEIITAEPRKWAERVHNAGCIFVGTNSPVSLGDYCAGSNHVLPTGCTARHSSGLSVQSFLKGVHLVEYDRDALVDVAAHVVALANAEDLPAHGAAVSARLR